LRAFARRVLRRIFRAKRDEVADGWRQLHKEEFYNLYSLPSSVMIRSRRVRWAGHVARVRKMRNTWEKLAG
jgi:hypothetical protein